MDRGTGDGSLRLHIRIVEVIRAVDKIQREIHELKKLVTALCM